MYFILIIGLSYLMYRKGMRYLFRSKLLQNASSANLAYIFLMLSGVLIGEYFSIMIVPNFYVLNRWSLIILATISSIISGEIIYNRNYNLVKKIVTSEKD